MDTNKHIFHFQWKIENFACAPHSTGQFISSPSFCAEILDGTRWGVLLYPRGKENCIDIAVKRKAPDNGGHEIPVKIAIELEAADSTLRERCESGNLLCNRNSVCYFDNFIKRSTLFNLKETLLPNESLTIHCTLWRVEIIMKEFVGMTQIGLRRCFFSWQIPNWSQILLPEFCNPYEEEAPYIRDVKFPDELENLFRLFLCRNTNHDSGLRLDVVKLDPRWKTVLKSRIALVDDRNTEILATETIHQFNKGANFATDNILRLRCELTIPNGIHQSSIQPVFHESIHEEPDNTEETFSRHTANLLREGKFCDVKVRAGDVEIPCHKFVLYDKSPVLKKILSNLEQDVIDINSVDGQTLKQMIDFMYTKKIDNLQYTSALTLLAATQKFQIHNLKEKCSEYLKTAFTFKNITDIIIAADLHNVQDLMESSVNYVTRYWKEISATQKWQNFERERPNLSKRIYLYTGCS